MVDVDTFTIQNMFELNYGFPPNQTIALINVGASVVNINVIANGLTTFTRDISMGGGLLTAELQKQLKQQNIFMTKRGANLYNWKKE